MIIAAFSGVGKTTFAKLYPQTVKDFICMPYKYYLDDDDEQNEEGKANPDNILRLEWPLNYVNAIVENDDKNRILLIPSDCYVLLSLQCLKIPYTLCYPQRKAKKTYHKRFIKRGNTKNFIDIFIGGWNEFMDSLESDSYGRHIVLKPNQFLSDVIDVGALNPIENKKRRRKMPNDTSIPSKNDQKEILNLLRIREFVVCCSLDYDNDLSLNDKLILSKYLVSREYIADQIKISRHFQNKDDEILYHLLLEGEDARLCFLLNILFKGDQNSRDNCIKKMKMHYSEFEDYMSIELQHSRGEKLNKMIFLYLNEKYRDDMFLYFKD